MQNNLANIICGDIDEFNNNDLLVTTHACIEVIQCMSQIKVIDQNPFNVECGLEV